MHCVRARFHSAHFFWSILLLGGALAGGCRTASHFSITNEPATSTPFVGFGAQFNPYLYCRPNAPDVNEQNVRDLESKLIDLRPQHVRVFCLLDWWTPAGDRQIARGDPAVRSSFIRTVRLAQRAGATVNVTLWYGPWTDPEAQMARFAAILAELVRVEKLSAIQYVTIQNEPNGESEKGPYKITFETYNRLYRALDQELRRVDLRRQIRIVGGDLVARQQRRWILNLGTNLADVCDGYSMHAYWDYWDTEKLLRRVGEVPAMVAELPAAQRRPLYVTEFGVRGIRQPGEEPGRFGDGRLVTDTIAAAQQLAWFDIEAINHGYVATVQWDAFDAFYDTPMRYGLIGDMQSGWKLRPAYHMLRLLAHSVRPGWMAMKVVGSSPDQSVAAMRGPEEQVTLFAQNRSEHHSVVTLTDLPAGRVFLVTFWNAQGDGRLSTSRAVDSDERGRLTIELPPVSVAALTAG
jgi:hypothetical protein